MIIKYAKINRYINYNNLEINLDNTYNYCISDNNENLKLIAEKNNVPEDFFSSNVNLSCFIGRNGSGKSLIMSLLTSCTNQSHIHSENAYKIVFNDNSKGLFYLLVVENGTFSFKSGKVQKKDDNYLVELQDADETILEKYNSYYLSSNNTNMMKSWVVNIDNDYSVGNERRYKGLHSLVEISQFIESLPFGKDLADICNSKHVRLVITDRWLSQLNLSFMTGREHHRRDLTSLVKEVKKIGPAGYLIIARLILLRVILSNPHKTNSVSHAAFKNNSLGSINELNTRYLSAITEFDINVLSNATLFSDLHYERMVHILSEIITYNDKSEIQIDFAVNDIGHKELLEFLLEISLKNEIIADGYKYYFSPPFSTGQWKRVELICKVNNIYQNIKPNGSVNIFIDEPDADLHPEIQTKLVSWLIDLMKEMSLYFNVVLSSHNPLILSDFPRRKVIYIGNDILDQDKCKTLGANIYNLYKNSFLVKSVISDFIRTKIESAVNSNDIDNLSFLINEISEPLLVKSLTSHLKKIVDVQENQNDRISSFVDGLSDSEKAFLKRKLISE